MSNNKTARFLLSSKAPGGSVICSPCGHDFPSSVNFNLGTDDKLDFQLKLFKKTDDGSTFVSQGFTYEQQLLWQDDVRQSCSVECPTCGKIFELVSRLIKTVKDSQLKIELCITTTRAVEKEEKEPRDKQHNIPSLHRVKVFYKCPGKTFGGDRQIKEQLLKDELQRLHVQETNLKDSDVVIVFCPITSRVGSDVESCMRDKAVSSLNKPIILVLMHHTRDFDYSTQGKRWSEDHPNVVLDVNVLFHETKPGLLTCEKNEEAFEMIREELNKHSNPSTRMLAHQK